MWISRAQGLYRYAQSPDFEILLFGFSFDNAPVHVVDLHGEKVPDWIIGACMTQCREEAFNAAFEWYAVGGCGWRQTGYSGCPLRRNTCYLSTNGGDTMLHALYCGYPGSLEASGGAIGLPTDKQKLTTVKPIKAVLVSPPSQLNEMDSARGLTQRMSRRSGRCTKNITVRTLSQRQQSATTSHPGKCLSSCSRSGRDILQNERVVRLDMPLVHGALYCAEVAWAEHMDEARALQGLDNPNSDAQLIAWINTQEGGKLATRSQRTS